MFGIGWTEFILVALVVLIFVGPKHLPDMLRKFGRVVGELRAASRELRNQLDVEMGDLESPSRIMKNVADDIASSIPSPYESISQAEEALKKEARDIAEATAEPTPVAEAVRTEKTKEDPK